MIQYTAGHDAVRCIDIAVQLVPLATGGLQQSAFLPHRATPEDHGTISRIQTITSGMSKIWETFILFGDVLSGIVAFAGWILCVIHWARGGCRFPRLIHFIALTFLAIGVATVLTFVLMTRQAVIDFLWILFLPPLLVYVLWLLLAGLIHDRRSGKGKDVN